MSDGSMKMDSVRGTGQSSSPVPLTWGFCIDSRNTRVSKHGKTCQKMSLVEVVCDVSSLIVIFGPAPNLEVCVVSILGWEDLCNSLRYVTLPYHPLEIAKLGVA